MSRVGETLAPEPYEAPPAHWPAKEPQRNPRLIPDGMPLDVAMGFRRLADTVWKAGVRRTSADFILHRLRWEEQIEKRNDDFKLNNNWTSQLARWYQANNPERASLFETRKLKEERDAKA